MDIDNSDLIEVPPSQLLFNEQLYHTQNSKLKQVKVQLRQSTTPDGNKVFNLDIKGVNHKYHFQLDFAGQELCFMHLEEVQDSVRETSCLSCLDRNLYPTIVYSRLLMLLYSDSDNSNEARCIKVPFVQRGNINATTTLLRLQHVIYNNVVSTENLKHWLVYVVRCGGMQTGERVFLCLTSCALIIVFNYHILHYHAYCSSQMSVRCDPEEKEIEFTVHDKTWMAETHGTENFALFKTYTFKTTQCQKIEKNFGNLMRKCQQYSHGPSAHFNIRHSEISASVVPGTTSDNVMIISHDRHWPDNNNSGSTSGSNGHIPSGKLDNLETFHETSSFTDIVPRPHYHESEHTALDTTSSNDSIPGSDNLAVMFVSHAEVSRESKSPHELLLNPGVEAKADTVMLAEHTTSPSPHDTMPKSIGGDSAPSDNHHGNLMHHFKTPSESNLERFAAEVLGDDNMAFYSDFIETAPTFATIDEADSLPTPQPCTSFSTPFVEFPHKPTIVPPSFMTLSEDELAVPERLPMHGILRSQSFLDLMNEDMAVHQYANITQELSSRGSVHDDFPYYRFYYNIGLIRVVRARMSKKLKRRNRFSREMKEVDFNKLEDHEQWYDRDFKVRTKDLKFCNLYNIPPEAGSDVSNYHKIVDEADDPYWSQNDLCFTIQRILEEGPKERDLFREVQAVLDVTTEQLMQVQVLLSLTPTENNWKVLAEYIGLNSSDISIIEHFCYTYRKLAADVVLTQWMLRQQSAHQQIPVPCHWDSLVQFLDQHDRNDISSILRSTRENEDIMESTYF